jgi:uncharacterized protein
MQAAANPRVQLLIFQATAFCNIDCKYCYLPNRLDTRRISPSLISRAVERVIETGWLKDRLSVVWHAGEPLTVGHNCLEQLIDACAPLSAVARVQHRVQTNATLIDARFCEIFKAKGVRIGVSIDGPADLHDRNRIRRNKTGTFNEVIRGIQYLKEFSLPFDAICVLTAASLDRAEEIYEFFSNLGAATVGFNVDELEGMNRHSTIYNTHSMEKLANFWDRIFRIHFERRAFRLREADSPLDFLRHGGLRDHQRQLVDPFTILTVGVDGSVGTFCPELLGQKHPRFGDFSIGNIESQSFDRMMAGSRFLEMKAEIQSGVDRCKQECMYFDMCGGGAPSNKVSEHGSFDVTETMHCKATKKLLIDALFRQVRMHRSVKAASSLERSVWTLPDTLDGSACERIIAAANSAGWSSGGRSVDNNDRSVELPTRSYSRANVNLNPILSVIGPSIPSTIEDMHFAGLSAEKTICLRYLPGESFPAHVDSPNVVSNNSHSLFTIIVYLNDQYEGGETYFPDYDRCIQPATGTSLIFAHGLRHEGRMIKSGIKYALLTYLQYSRVEAIFQSPE